MKAGFEYAHADMFVGMRFPMLFERAGFRDVTKDLIVNSGVATEEEIGLDTLEQRLGEAIMSANAVFSLPTVIGGWGRRPE